MHAMRPSWMTPRTGRAVAWAALAGWLACGLLGCGGSTPMDMWISRDPDAGRDFDAPMREVRLSDGSGGSGGTGGTGGTGGDTGSGGTGGTAGDGAGTGGDTGGGGAGGTS